MKQVEMLIAELKENSLKIGSYIFNENIDQALKLSEHRLIILSELNEIFLYYPDFRVEIKTLCEGLLPLEYNIISEVSKKKEIVVEQLAIVSKLNKVGKEYRKIAEE